jgi:hypothetical protein
MPISTVKLTEENKRKSKEDRIPPIIRFAVKKVVEASEAEKRYSNYWLLQPKTVTRIFMLYYYMMGRESDQSIAREVGLNVQVVGRAIRQGNVLLKSKNPADHKGSVALFAKYCTQFKNRGQGDFKLRVKQQMVRNAVRSKKVSDQVRVLRTIDPQAFEYQPQTAQASTFNQTNIMIGEVNVQQILSLPVEERIQFLRQNQSLISPELRGTLNLLDHSVAEIECKVSEDDE